MSAFAGMGALLRLQLRRDRLGLFVWVLLVSLVPIGVALSFARLYPSAAALDDVARSANSLTATVGMLGFVYSPSVGALTAWRTGLNSAALIVPVSIVLMMRYSSREELLGRRELLGGNGLGRLAPVASALLLLLSANLAIALLITVGLAALGLPLAGALMLGLTAAATGWLFAALTGFLAQLAVGPGRIRSVAFATFALAWMLRAYGDLRSTPGVESFLSWLSPLGWSRLTHAFAGERWGVLALPVVGGVLLATLSLELLARRDLGEGLLPTRDGAARRTTHLHGVLELTWRQQRGQLLGWTAALLGFGVLLGSASLSLSTFTSAAPFQTWAARSSASTPGAAFVSTVVYVLGQVVAAVAISSVLSLRTEEETGRADLLLAPPLSRLRWAVVQLGVVFLGPVLLLGACGLGLGLASGAAVGNLGVVLPLLGRTLATLPAVWVLAGLTFLVYGVLPRLAVPVGWAALAAALLLELGWELRVISPALFGVSPFAHVYWASPVTLTALLTLTAIAFVFVGVGLLALRQRDL